MLIQFFEPPNEKKIGGLDAAIRSLQAALGSASVRVISGEESLHPDADLAHFHGLWQIEHATLSQRCRADGVPYVVSPHGMLELWAWRHKLWKKMPYFYLRERAHLGGADCLLATSESEARRLREFFPRASIRNLPLGLTGEAQPDYEEARRKLDWTADERVLLFLSRVHPKKGLDLLLRALIEPPLLDLTREPARLVIVGDGEASYVAEIKSFCERNATSLPRIDWIGEVWGDARWPYFQGADLFCLPTHSENFGLVVLEACQVGTPVLTTTMTPWAAELGNGHRRGFICEPRVENIRSALSQFFSKPKETPDQRRELAAWAWQKFHWSALAPQYADVYSLSRKAARAEIPFRTCAPAASRA